MISADDHPGLFFFMIGIIVVVMTAVGLSLVADRKFEFASRNEALREELSEDQLKLEELRVICQSRGRDLANFSVRNSEDSKGWKSVVVETKLMEHRKEEMRRQIAELKLEIGAVERDFVDYRDRYRRRAWAAAKGERLGEMRTAGGKFYRNVVVTLVTEAGLEIRHEDGIARIQAPDLEPKWHDRFQWDETRRQELLAREVQHAETHASVKKLISDREREAFPENGGGSPREVAELNSLRQLVYRWQSKESSVKLELSEAMSRAQHGGQASVPGSLETWAAKSARISKELVRVRTELNLAKAKLAAVNPSDPLLRARSLDN
jgi:hypothetical protein